MSGRVRRCDRQLALSLRQAQARRAQAAAASAARRRAVIGLALCLLGMVAGVVVLEREIQLQAQEVRRG
jgi:cation transporter-like permease